jgi:hypothetical protein
MAGTLASHPRVRALFQQPAFPGTQNEYRLLARTPINVQNLSEDGLITVICPYCTWKNTHNIQSGGGHRECDGPVDSQFTTRGARRPKYKPYNCPGYTLVVQ